MTNPSAAPATETCAQRVPAHAHTDGSLGRNQQGGRSGLRSATLLVASVLWLGQTAAAQQPPYRPAPPAARAQPSRSAPTGPLEVDITQGTLKPIPIAVPEFMGEDPQFAREVSDLVAADLERSGLFEPLDRGSFIEAVRDLNAPPRFQDWRLINAQALVIGRAGRAPDGRVVGEFRLWDIYSGRQLAAQRFAVVAQEWRRLGHLVADQVYQRLTAERGYFDTQIVFVDETGPKDHRSKRLAIMDQDGANVRLLSQGRELVLTPRFSPTTQNIVFMQYTGDQPRVFVMNLESGQRELLGNFPGMTFAAILSRWATRRHEHRRGRRHCDRRDGPAQPPDAPPDADQRHRYGALLQPRRQVHRLRVGSGRDPAALCDGERWRRATAHQLRRGPLFHARLVAARGSHRLH